MPYQIIVPKRVEKAILGLDAKIQDKILSMLKTMSVNPFAPNLDVKRMQGTSCTYRLRLGKLRILLDIIEKKQEIHLLKVGFRGDVYKKG